MSCRVSVSGRPHIADLISGPDVGELYRDLVDAGRQDDFRWLALSQGLSAERIDELRRFVRAPGRAQLTHARL